jgi:hypothetical protein
MDHLDEAFAERSGRLLNIKEAPVFDPLRGERRFQELLRRMNLPPTR